MTISERRLFFLVASPTSSHLVAIVLASEEVEKSVERVSDGDPRKSAGKRMWCLIRLERSLRSSLSLLILLKVKRLDHSENQR